MRRGEFQKRVWAAARRIPRGKVTTYAAIAKAVGRPQAGRAVGNALGRNPYAPKVPCHRVVRGDGGLGGYAGGIGRKTTLLRRERVSIVGEKIDLRRFGYFFGRSGRRRR